MFVDHARFSICILNAMSESYNILFCRQPHKFPAFLRPSVKLDKRGEPC
jgi:hypothetical protein